MVSRTNTARVFYTYVNCEITFQPWTKLKNIRIRHDLWLDGEGNFYNILLEVAGETTKESESNTLKKIKEVFGTISKVSNTNMMDLLNSDKIVEIQSMLGKYDT
jgi:hypothetical protein